MSYEYVAKTQRDSSESVRVMEAILGIGMKPVAVRYKPETNSVVVYFSSNLKEEDKEKLDKAMSKLGYMVMV